MRHREERSDAAIHKALISKTPSRLFAALTLRASLRLFNALRALVPRFARNDKCINQRFPRVAGRPSRRFGDRLSQALRALLQCERRGIASAALRTRLFSVSTTFTQ